MPRCIRSAGYGRKILVATARDHRLVPYMEMANAHGGRGYFGQVLDELNRREHAKGHPLISAIVVSAQSHEPSEGFYKLVEELKLASGRSRRQIWETERDRVWAFDW